MGSGRYMHLLGSYENDIGLQIQFQTTTRTKNNTAKPNHTLKEGQNNV